MQFFVTADFRFNDMHITPNIIRVNKSRRMRWARKVARMGDSRVAYGIFVEKPEGKRPFGRLRRRWDDNIKMDLQEVRFGDINWIDLAQGWDRWWALVNAVTNLWGSIKWGEFLD